MKRRAATLLLPVLVAASCTDESLPPSAQLLVYLTTDAPLPPPPGGALAADEPRPLFDRVRIEITKPGEQGPCATCTREFDLDRELVVQRRASIGIVPRVGERGYVARVRLFTASRVRAGEPTEARTIDVVADLPPIAAVGLTETTIELLVKDVGVPRSKGVAVPGPPREDVAGSFLRGRPRACAGAPRPDEACVPGGAYWMGEEADQSFLDRGLVASGKRLVELAPFYMQVSEVSIGDFRRSNLAEPGDPATGADCPWTLEPRPDEDRRPVGCVTWAKARAYCLARGGDLPTEAQYEYAASGTTGQRYVWGDDDPTCADAVYGHVVLANGNRVDGVCQKTGGASTSGQGARDRLVLSGGLPIVDLAGNMREWARDAWNDDPGGACWRAGLFRDPYCDTPGVGVDPTLRTKKGGSFVEGPVLLRAAQRAPSDRGQLDLGFRCVRSP